MTPDECKRHARETYEWFSDHEFDRVLEKSTENFEARVFAAGFEQPFQGREGLRTFMEGWKQGFPDARVEIVEQVAGEDTVTNECLYRGTHTGQLLPPLEAVPPTGKRVELHFCEVWRFRDGKLASIHNYQDSVSLMAQLDLLPQPERAQI